MKSIILFTIISLMLLSCGESIPVQKEQSESPDSSLKLMNINGKIKSIKEVEYDAVLNDNLGVDITSAKKGEIISFNEDGYLTKSILCDTNGIHVNCNKDDSYILTYNSDYNILLKEIYNTDTLKYETSISNIYDNNGLLKESYIYLSSSIFTHSRYVYYKDTGLLKLITTEAFNNGINLNMSSENSYIYNIDGTLNKEGSNFNNINTVTYYEYNSIKKLKIKNKFRIEYSDNSNDVKEVEVSLVVYEGDKLVREDLKLDTLSESFVAYEYDENGNLAHRVELDKNDNLIKRDRYKYDYDYNNNWLRKYHYNSNGVMDTAWTREYNKN